MIIAVYAGCGLSAYARATWDGVDLSAVPYRYVLPETTSEQDLWEIEDRPYPPDPNWPMNYIRAITMAYHRYGFVVIPILRTILEELKRLRIPYVLLYPEEALSGQDGGWLASDDYGKHLMLAPGQTPAEYRDAIDRYVKEEEIVLPLNIDRKMIEDFKKRYETGELCMEEQIRQELIAKMEDLANGKK